MATLSLGMLDSRGIRVDLITPLVPTVSIHTGKQLKVSAGAAGLDHVIEFIGHSENAHAFS